MAHYLNKTDKDSTLLHTENVALFAKPPINIGEEKVMWVTHDPDFMSSDRYSTVTFNIPGSGTQYTDLSRTLLYVRIRITDMNGNTFVQDKDKSALPVDQILHSMWSSVDIKFNSKLVSTSGNNYMYKSLIENLLNYGENSRKFQMNSIGFSGESGNFAQTHPTKPPVNYGLKNRSDWFKKVEQMPGATNDPTSIEFMGPLMADICNLDRYILNGVEIDVKLWPNRDEFRLITHPSGTEAKLKIEEIKLLVCKITLSPMTLLAHSEVLKDDHVAVYPIQKTDIRTKNIPKDSYGETIENIYQGQVPSRLIIGLVESEAYSGSYNKNPYHFNHFNISKVGFYVDGESVPTIPLELNFTDNKYLQGLMSLYQVSGKLNEDADIGITRNSYREGYALIGFEVDPTSSTDFTYLGQRKTGRTRLEISFSRPLPKAVSLILYAVFPQNIIIDESRVVRLQHSDDDDDYRKKKKKKRKHSY